MPWPNVPVTTVGMDQDADTLPRSDILDLTTKFNQLIAMLGVANGVCDLDANGKIPPERLGRVFGTYTTASLAPNSSDERSITHGLGTDNIDFGATMFGSLGLGGSTAVRAIMVMSNKKFVTAGAYLGVISLSAYPVAGDILIRSTNDAGSAQAITVNWWAKIRN